MPRVWRETDVRGLLDAVEAIHCEPDLGAGMRRLRECRGKDWHILACLRCRARGKLLAGEFAPEEADAGAISAAARELIRQSRSDRAEAEAEFGSLHLARSGAEWLGVVIAGASESHRREIAAVVLHHWRVAESRTRSAPVPEREAPGSNGRLESTESPVLTPREREVSRLLRAGKTNREVATLLGISDRTVGKHRDNLYAKLRVLNRVQLVRRFLGMSAG